jgi:hypothetical protein
MASIQELLDEIILKVIKFLNIKDLVNCDHLSKRMRKIRLLNIKGQLNSE